MAMINFGAASVARWLPNQWVATRGDKARKVLYLTFDDGPNPDVTPPLLDLLAEHQAKASFFCIGRKVDAHPDIVRRIAAEGHVVANHSYNHKQFARRSLAERWREMEAGEQSITNVLGARQVIFRAPYGQLSLPLLIRLKAARRVIVHWSYNSMDYEAGSVEAGLVHFHANPVVAGDVILFHDDNLLCIEMLRRLLPQWQAQGFRFANVNELVEAG